MTSCTGSVRGGFWGFEKKLVEWSFSVRRRRLTFGDGKVSIERLCLSLPYVEKPFNSKVIKSFVPELRSCKCCCISDSLCTYHVFMYGYVIHRADVCNSLLVGHDQCIHV